MAENSANGTPVSLRDLILQKDDIETEIVPVPQWGVELEVRGLSGRARAAFMREFIQKDGELDYDRLYPALVINTVHDPATGERVFTDADYEAINAKSGAALETVAKVATRLSGLDEGAVDKAGKGSGSTRKKSSTST